LVLAQAADFTYNDIESGLSDYLGVLFGAVANGLFAFLGGFNNSYFPLDDLAPVSSGFRFVSIMKASSVETIAYLLSTSMPKFVRNELIQEFRNYPEYMDIFSYK